jgi:hypothetical protein
MLWLNFCKKIAVFGSKNANFSAIFCGENIFKIITSVPDLLKEKQEEYCRQLLLTHINTRRQEI